MTSSTPPLARASASEPVDFGVGASERSGKQTVGTQASGRIISPAAHVLAQGPAVAASLSGLAEGAARRVGDAVPTPAAMDEWVVRFEQALAGVGARAGAGAQIGELATQAFPRGPSRRTIPA